MFPFRVFIKEDYVKGGISTRCVVDDIIQSTGVDQIQMDQNNQVPDFPGEIMIIESDDIAKREAALL